MASIKAYYGRTYRGSKNRFLDFLQKRIDEKKGCFVVTANPEIFMLGKKMPLKMNSISFCNIMIRTLLLFHKYRLCQVRIFRSVQAPDLILHTHR